MQPPERDEVGGPEDWIRRARSCFALAQVPKPDDTCWEDLCFLAQQTAEKAIKAVMHHRDVRYPYVHDLGRLISELEASGFLVPEEVKKCVTITLYATQTRYPGEYEPLSEEDYRQAIKHAECVLKWAERVIQGD